MKNKFYHISTYSVMRYWTIFMDGYFIFLML